MANLAIKIARIKCQMNGNKMLKKNSYMECIDETGSSLADFADAAHRTADVLLTVGDGWKKTRQRRPTTTQMVLFDESTENNQ